MGLADNFIKSTKLKGSGRFSKVLEEPKEMHDTGIPALNLAYSGDLFGGTEKGVTCLAGKSKSFKTLFGLISCKAYMDKYPEAYMVFYDSEGGASQEYFESVGIDTERVIYIPIMDVEELKTDIMNKLMEIKESYTQNKEYERFIFFVDSIGNLASIKEVKDAQSGNPAADMGTRAKALKAFFRIVTPYFTNYNMQMIAIMHTYDEMAAMGAPKQIMSGGCLAPGTKIKMLDGSFKSVEDIQVDEYVQTMNGPSRVYETWNPETLEEGEPECIEVTFEDGNSVVCSETHKFLIDDEWVEAKDLVGGEEVANM